MSALRFRSPRYIAFIKRQPCLGEHTHLPTYNPFYLVIDPEHTVSQKWNKGSDGMVVPACRVCHDEVTKHGKEKAEWWYNTKGVHIAGEWVRLHTLFLREEGLTMLPDETFEQCLERNGLGRHARNKSGKTVRPTKSTFLSFARWVPLKDRT